VRPSTRQLSSRDRKFIPSTSISSNAGDTTTASRRATILPSLSSSSVAPSARIVPLAVLSRIGNSPRPSFSPAARAVLAESAVTVAGEADALRRALENLLENAEVHGEGEVVVSLTLEDGRAVLAVSDEGPGFAPGDADHAFERFWRGPGARGRPGSGLGLAIVRATAERHGGTVAASGATVRIAIPGTAVASAAAASPA